jgi:lipopolysaccharide export system protein LptA
MTGSGLGMTYDKNQDIMVVLDQVVILMEAGNDQSGLQIASGSAEFRRTENLVRFERSLHVVRETKTIDADAGVAHLSADGARLELFEMRGSARIVEVSAPPGGLQTMTARDMDLKYGADGQTLEQALLVGDAVIQVAGPPGQVSRRISAMTIDSAFGPDGATPTALNAHEGVDVLIPAEPGGAVRTIHAQSLDASGKPPGGLDNARFTGDVQFRERGPDGGRAARSGVLDLTLAPGFGAMEEARFSQSVRFEENNMASDSATARYVLDKGTLELGGREPAHERPHLVHERIGIYGNAINVELAGPKVNAKGDVKSVLQPASKEKDGAEDEGFKMPSMLKPDQVVNVTANELQYDGLSSKALYSGNALLWQGETSIKAATITIDDKRGDMSASGKVATSVVLAQATGPAGELERSRSTTTAAEFLYEEAVRRATYTGDAHMNSIEGDITGGKIELYLKPSGDELDRAETYASSGAVATDSKEKVTLREKTRLTTGSHLTYFSADQRYVVTGTPVSIVDECKRETTGRTLTFFRTTDRIVVDGSEQIRAQTKGGSTCTGQ